MPPPKARCRFNRLPTGRQPCLCTSSAPSRQRFSEGKCLCTTRCLSWSVLLAAVVLGGLKPECGLAQLRDTFEGPELTWQLAKEADCGVRVLAHERTYREAHSGQASEHFQLILGNGTFVPLVHVIGRTPVIQELLPTVYVKADRASVQLLVRAVLPRSVDRAAGEPIKVLLRGDLYTDVGQWQQLAVRDIVRLLEQETRALRAQFGPQIDSREAYVDLIVLNAYTGPGPVSLWIDDLEIRGYLNVAQGEGAQILRHASVPPFGSAVSDPNDPPALPAVQGSLWLVRGRPLMVRAIQHQGEPLQWLQTLGFNTVKLSASPSDAQLHEARRLGLWLIAPPPYADRAPPTRGFDPVIAWSLGSRLGQRDVALTASLAAEARQIEGPRGRPLLVGVDSEFEEYSRLAHLLAAGRGVLGTSQELADECVWLEGRSRLARPGTPLVGVLTGEVSPRIREQWLLLTGTPGEEDIDPQQLRLQGYHALAAGVRGLLVTGDQPLAIDQRSAAMRCDAWRLLNWELKLLEPWIAGGQAAGAMGTSDAGVLQRVWVTERSRLVLMIQQTPAGQYVLGPPPRSSVSLVITGVGAADRAWLVLPSAIKPLRMTHTAGGGQITLDDAPHAAAIVVTQDPLALHHLQRTLADIRAPACRLWHDVTSRRLAYTSELIGNLASRRQAPATATALLAQVQQPLQEAQRLLAAGDYEKAYDLTMQADRRLAQLRRAVWEQAAAVVPSPQTSPCLAQCSTLAQHWDLVARWKQARWGPNVQPAGDLESLDWMLRHGWQQHASGHDAVQTEVALSLVDPHGGRSSLRMRAWPKEARHVPPAFDRPPVWIVSGPVPVRQGQVVQIQGWVQVPQPLVGTTEGLVIFDSLGGWELGERVRLTRGWRPFTLYRAVPASGELRVTVALTGIGEAWLDDLSVRLLDPEPIRPQP